MPWRFIQGMNPPPAQAGSREGFKSDVFLTNSESGTEALKCALPLKTLRQEGSPLNKVWLRVAIPSTRPFMRATYYQMGERSTSPATRIRSRGGVSRSTVPSTRVYLMKGRVGPLPLLPPPLPAARLPRRGQRHQRSPARPTPVLEVQPRVSRCPLGWTTSLEVEVGGVEAWVCMPLGWTTPLEVEVEVGVGLGPGWVWGQGCVAPQLSFPPGMEAF